MASVATTPWMPALDDRVVCDGRRPLGSGPYVDDYNMAGVIVAIATDESDFGFYVGPQDGTHHMLTNITQMKHESDGALPNFLHMTRDIIRRWGPVTASISIQIFLEHF